MQARSGDSTEETDWAEIFTELLSLTSMSYESITERTIPQVNAIRRKLGKYTAIKLGIPIKDEAPVNPGRPPKLSELQAFCGAFSGM